MSTKKYIISIAMIFALVAVSLSAVSAADSNNLDSILIHTDDMGSILKVNEGSSEIISPGLGGLLSPVGEILKIEGSSEIISTNLNSIVSPVGSVVSPAGEILKIEGSSEIINSNLNLIIIPNIGDVVSPTHKNLGSLVSPNTDKRFSNVYSPNDNGWQSPNNEWLSNNDNGWQSPSDNGWQ